MSIQDIANYVRQTPGNTNPSVITSMVKSEVGEYVEEASNEALRKLGIEQKTTKTYIVPEATYSFVDGIVDINIATLLREGDNATIIIDGVAYTETVKRTLLDEETAFYIGNMTPFGVDSGADKPYLVLQDSNSALSVGIIAEAGGAEATTHTIDIYVMEESITPISDKYLPKGKVGHSEWEVIFNHTHRFIGGASSIGDLDGDGITDGFPLVVGKRYMITFDGVDYEYTCEFVPGANIPYIGSPEFLENGVVVEEQAPVAFMDTSSMPQDGGTYIITADKTPTQHTVKVAVEKVTPIDPKYLGGWINLSDYGVSPTDLIDESTFEWKKADITIDSSAMTELCEKITDSTVGFVITGFFQGRATTFRLLASTQMPLGTTISFTCIIPNATGNGLMLAGLLLMPEDGIIGFMPPGSDA